MTRILIAEDEERIASFVRKGLTAAGYTVSTVSDGESAVTLATDAEFDLLILDLGLPRLDGHGVLRALRERGERIPVIILTARHGVSDKVEGFEGGADDYVTKPFEFEELLARVRARLRDPGHAEEESIEAGGIALNLRTRMVAVGERQVELSSREFALAETFFRHPGQVLSREQLLSRVWGYDYDPGSNIVDVYVRYLRQKLGPEVIETVRGAGYRLRDAG